jgi:hypothetical protein
VKAKTLTRFAFLRQSKQFLLSQVSNVTYINLQGFFNFGGVNNYSSFLDMRCVNDENGGPPFWVPNFDHEINPFPPCENMREYLFQYFYFVILYHGNFNLSVILLRKTSIRLFYLKNSSLRCIALHLNAWSKFEILVSININTI